MTKAAALHQFFSGFGMDAYTDSSVPDDAVFPYLTYELINRAIQETMERDNDDPVASNGRADANREAGE